MKDMRELVAAMRDNAPLITAGEALAAVESYADDAWLLAVDPAFTPERARFWGSWRESPATAE